MEDAWGLLCEVDASEQHGRTLRSVSWNSSGDLLVIASFDATASLWKEVPREAREDGALAFECAGVVTGHENEVKSAAFSPSGEFLATCSRDKSVWIYEADNKFEYECVALLQSHAHDVKMVRWHPSQDILFSCSYDNTVKIWGPDGDDWSCKQTLEGHESTVWCLGFNQDGSRFVTCSDDKDLRVWAPARDGDAGGTGGAAGDAGVSAGGPGPGSRVAMSAFVSPLFRGALAPGGASSAGALAPTADGTAGRIKPPADASCPWRCEATIQGHHPRTIFSVDWLPFPAADCATTIASACGDNRIRVFQPQNEARLEGWTSVVDVEGHDGDTNCVAWYPQALADGGALLASAGDDCEVRIWQLRYGNSGGV